MLAVFLYRCKNFRAVVAEYLALLQAVEFTRTSETEAFVRELREGVRLVRFP